MRSALLVALCVFAAGAQAAAPVFLEDLTTTEVREALRAGRTTILVPIGGTEQNGPHMALGKHNARVRILAGRIATALGDALVAPVMAYVPEGSIEPPAGHMRFAGTISVPGEAFEGVLEAAARSFRAHGFNDIVFLGDSGDYQGNATAVAARLNRAWAAGPARAHALVEYYRASGITGHANLDDTSLLMALAPGMVRAERLAADAMPPTPADGVRGDPRGASAERGAKIAERIVSASVEAIRNAVRR